MTTEAENHVKIVHAANERMFDATSGYYSTEQWFDHSARSPFVYEITLRRLLEAVELTGSEDVLEIGCGPGTWSRVIASRAGHLTSLDISQAMIDRACTFVQPYNVSFVHSDILHYTAQSTFECVVSLRAIEYVRDKDALVAKLAQLVSEDGQLVIVSKTPFSAWRGRRAIAAIRSRFSRRGARSTHNTETDTTSDAVSDGQSLQETYYHARISPWRLASMLRTVGFDRITIRPVIVGLPILQNAHDEGSDLPLVPSSLAPYVLRGFNALGDLLARAPQWTMPLTLWLSESYIVRARRHTKNKLEIGAAARRRIAASNTTPLMLLALVCFAGYWAVRHRSVHP